MTSDAVSPTPEERLKAAILDIDAHATPFGEDENGFVTGGYLISVGCLHRALGTVGHSSRKCRLCSPESHGCLESELMLESTSEYLRDALEQIAVAAKIPLRADYGPKPNGVLLAEILEALA